MENAKTKKEKMSRQTLCLREMSTRVKALERLVLVLVTDRLEASDLIHQQGQLEDSECEVKERGEALTKRWREFYLSRGHYRELLSSLARKIPLDE